MYKKFYNKTCYIIIEKTYSNRAAIKSLAPNGWEQFGILFTSTLKIKLKLETNGIRNLGNVLGPQEVGMERRQEKLAIIHNDRVPALTVN